MTFINYVNELRQKGKWYFTLSQAIADLKISRNAVLNAIYRLKTHRALISPAKGLYVMVPPEHQLQGCIPAEELLPIIMDYFKAEYYVSLLSSAQYHGATHQKPGSYQVIVNKCIKHPLEFSRIKIDLIYKKVITTLPLQNITVSTGYLKIASPELTTLDLFLYPAKSGGLNHIATVLNELAEHIDVNKLIKLANFIKEKAWLQRMGYILEQLEFMEEDKVKSIIEEIEGYLHGKLKYFIPLATELPKAGCPRIKKWSIIANTSIESDL